MSPAQNEASLSPEDPSQAQAQTMAPGTQEINPRRLQRVQGEASPRAQATASAHDYRQHNQVDAPTPHQSRRPASSRAEDRQSESYPNSSSGLSSGPRRTPIEFDGTSPLPRAERRSTNSMNLLQARARRQSELTFNSPFGSDRVESLQRCLERRHCRGRFK